ncbi:hypothetical protein RvY_10169 [Ramazzottius varieornatus]|uniref:Uncharacterized protein n=1 Tax=Ramazzottius varieornatus TaxID=947166 RepID=A0A1D1VEB2_RAMVA|nr:hypothetical protein RvY_10169 [Ramazzottius varieornatus]
MSCIKSFNGFVTHVSIFLCYFAESSFEYQRNIALWLSLNRLVINNRRESMRVDRGVVRSVVSFLVAANRNEAHEELSTVFPNYVDLLRSKGYSDQVEQWLFNLWKSGPSRSLLKTSHIDVRRYSKTSAESSTNMLGVVKSVSSFLKHKVFNCISTISSIIPSTPSASPASLKAVPSELPPLFISPQLSREDEEEIAEAALADELGLRDLSALRKADADFNPFHQEEPGPSPRNSRPNISNNDTDSENELPFHDATNTAPHANEEGPSVKPPSEPDASSVFDLYAEQNNFFSEYSIRMRQGKRMARNFLRPMPDNTESAVEMFRPTYSRPRSPVLPLVPLSTRRTDHVPVRREQQPVNLNALLKREAESITDDILSMHDNNGATQ